MAIILLGSICGIGLILAVPVGILLMIGGRDRDAVGAAREDWVSRRSDSDLREW
jgi:hypothetical protein